MNEKQRARELAYKVWVECGGNFSETERKLKRADLGLPVSRQTLMSWAGKYDWKGRAARVEAEERKREAAVAEDGLVAALGKQKERYERYFDTMAEGVVDNQACYAFCGLVKTMIGVRRGKTFTAETAEKESKSQITNSQSLITSDQSPVTIHKSLNDEERIAALEEMVDLSIGRLLADPEKVNANAWKDIRGALALIEQLRAKTSTAEIAENAETEAIEVEKEMREIANPEDAKAALWEAFSRMIAAMLDHPEKVKVGEIERAMGYLEKMQGKGHEEHEVDTKRAEEGRGKEKAEEPVKPEIDDIEEAEVLVDIGIWGEAEAIEALQGFVAKQLGMMRSETGAAKVGQVKAVKDAMELIEVLKKKIAPVDEGKKKKGLSSETADEVRAKIFRGETG
jgi:hypothetical protein